MKKVLIGFVVVFIAMIVMTFIVDGLILGVYIWIAQEPLATGYAVQNVDLLYHYACGLIFLQLYFLEGLWRQRNNRGRSLRIIYRYMDEHWNGLWHICNDWHSLFTRASMVYLRGHWICDLWNSSRTGIWEETTSCCVRNFFSKPGCSPGFFLTIFFLSNRRG